MAGQLTIDTLKASSGVLATQNGMTGIAKAWVSYNGNTTTIKDSFNVSSVTAVSAGNYIINFTTAMPNANYAVVGTSTWINGTTAVNIVTVNGSSLPTTTAVTIQSSAYNGGFGTVAYTGVAIFSS